MPVTKGRLHPSRQGLQSAPSSFDKRFGELCFWFGLYVERRMARKLDPPNPKANQGLHLRPKLLDLRVGECPGNSADQTGDAKIVDTAHSSGKPAVHD